MARAKKTVQSTGGAKTALKGSVSKTAVSKTAVSKTVATKSAVEAAPKPVVVKTSTPTVSDPALKKKELIEAVTERSGVKKRDAKPVVEAMLAILGQTLADGREMNLQPLGKIKLNRSKEVQGGTVLIAKVRQSNRKPAPKDPLAEAAE